MDQAEFLCALHLQIEATKEAIRVLERFDTVSDSTFDFGIMPSFACELQLCRREHAIATLGSESKRTQRFDSQSVLN